MAVKEKPENVSDEIEWNVDTEVQLFYAMHGHKPVGVNKYFHMACIVEKFRNSLNKDVSSQAIWDHLDTMYDMQALDDTENLPFPNDEKEFNLPEAEFATLIELKCKVPVEYNIQDDRKQAVLKSVKEQNEKRETNIKEIKDSPARKEQKDTSKENIKKEIKESKEPKKITLSKDIKDVRRESKDSKDGKRESSKKDGRETPKDVKREAIDTKDQKIFKQRGIKEKRDYRKDEDTDDVSLATLTSKKDRLKELSEVRSDDSPKRGGKRSTRGSMKPDDSGSNKSSSPITVATPPPMKRRRT